MSETEINPSVETSTATANTKDDHPQPWPYLHDMFELKVAVGKKLKFVCLLCQPRHYEMSAHYNLPSNLCKHVQVKSITNVVAY